MDGSRPLPMVCADLDRLREELKQLYEACRRAAGTNHNQPTLRPDTGLVVRGK
jgi:hypothetical protein